MISLRSYNCSKGLFEDIWQLPYTINKNRIQKNYTEFLKAVDDVKALLPAQKIALPELSET